MDIAGLSAVSMVWPVSATARSTTADTATGSTGNDSTGLADRGRPGDNSATHTTTRPIDPDLPTGPPPAFSTTPLELEGDWQVLLARISAAGYAQVQAMAPPSDSGSGVSGGPRGGQVMAPLTKIASPPEGGTASPTHIAPPQAPVPAPAKPSASAGTGAP